uniref:Uncharacterized protein n=1 Tax=Oncorhynchus tshawytscha TaxID=74940 RepID=A0A8C8JDQ2_ONCTS
TDHTYCFIHNVHKHADKVNRSLISLHLLSGLPTSSSETYPPCISLCLPALALQRSPEPGRVGVALSVSMKGRRRATHTLTLFFCSLCYVCCIYSP